MKIREAERKEEWKNVGERHQERMERERKRENSMRNTAIM